MSTLHKSSNYQITSDPNFQNEHFGNTPKLIAQFEGLYRAAMNPKDKKIIDQLTDLILKHPKSPQLKNFLSVAYHVRGNHKKAQEANKWILSEHPDYLFAKINLANEYMNVGQPERVPEVLGEDMEINKLYPERDLFHLAEVTGFYRAAIRYYVAIGNLDLAENRLKILQDIAPDNPDTEVAETLVRNLLEKKVSDRWKEDQANRIEIENVKPVPYSIQKTPPVFVHPEIMSLYEYGLDIPPEKLRTILALKRETLIADLEKVLKDAVDRYKYFIYSAFSEGELDFPLHAICLLAELKSEKSLPLVLDFLEYDEEVLDFWLGDHVNETIWLPIYKLSQNSVEVLKQFLLKPGVGTYSKAAVSETLAQIALNHLQSRNEIERIFQEVFTVFLHAELKDNLIDSGFLGLAIADTIDCGFIGLLPVIKKLYDRGYVSFTINGDYEEVKQLFKDPTQRKEAQKIEPIFELYDKVVNTWATYSDDLVFDDEFNLDEIEKPAVFNKIGRNDPCPCGSGKKYKKCCLGKEE
ncbi:MAG: DUF1186 domain-containing protein [Ginsengibacter sp.]